MKLINVEPIGRYFELPAEFRHSVVINEERRVVAEERERRCKTKDSIAPAGHRYWVEFGRNSEHSYYIIGSIKSHDAPPYLLRLSPDKFNTGFTTELIIGHVLVTLNCKGKNILTPEDDEFYLIKSIDDHFELPKDRLLWS